MYYYSRNEAPRTTPLLNSTRELRAQIVDCQLRGSTRWRPSEFAPYVRNYLENQLLASGSSKFWHADSAGRYKQIKSRCTLAGRAIAEIMSEPTYSDDSKVCAILELWADDDNDFRYVRDWHYFLTSKFSVDVRCCNDCEYMDLRENGQTTYQSRNRWVCDSCIDEHYTYSDNQDTFITTDDYDREQEENDNEEEEDGPIGSYHSSKRFLRHIPSSADNRKPQVYVGMELEVEVKDSYSVNSIAQELVDELEIYSAPNGRSYTYMGLEYDGSLDRGFEMVTGWSGLDVHRQQLTFFKRPINGLRSHDTRTCGLHVHISKADMTLFHGAKLSLFIHDSNNQKLVKDIARRTGASYAKVLNKKADYAWLHSAKRSSNDVKYQLTRLNADRYEALNFHNEETVEFRMFKGTLRYETQIACLEFAYMSWFFTRDTGINSLTTENFIKYICETKNRKDSKYLRKYLKDKGYVLPKSAVTKDNPRIDSVSQPIETATSINV